MNSLIKKDIQNMTLAEIQNDADEIIIKKNQLKIQKRTNDEIITIQIDSFPDGQFMNLGRVKQPEKKSDLKETILMLLDQGFKQKDIAFKLGISQSLVSKIKKKYKY